MVTQVTKHDRGMTPITLTVIQSYDIEKDIKSIKIDNIIQYSNNILALWKAHVVKIIDDGLDSYFHFSFYFILFLFFFYSSIFRATQVRVYQSRCHICHKVMAKSQD